MKPCYKCKQSFPLDNFSRDPKKKDGLATYCKPCAAHIAREWTRKNRERSAEIRKRYREKNREKVADFTRLYYEKNRDALLEKKRQWTRENYEKARQLGRRYSRKSNLKKYAGLTLEAFDAKLEKQNGRCAICETSIAERGACVDHCHETGNVRELLCSPCNISLGHIERPGFLEKAVAYLERHRSVDKEPRDNTTGRNSGLFHVADRAA